MKRAIIIHGHFYQPPRENPWLGVIFRQPGASPYHDWNERINAECYAPNSVSRLLNHKGLITRLVNNYRKISFNFGPTLINWLRAQSPSVYTRVIDADIKSMAENQGHGNAIAQCYNHMIMPLANRQDKITQVVWGIRDFMFHFGRRPEGMWLPETAVDLETLDILAEQGIRFTILSPHQAEKIKPLRAKRWKRVNSESIDTSRPYLQRLPTGREIVIFFYNSNLSHQVAFGDLLKSGDNFASRLLGEPLESKDLPLLSIATDGETYGHHHKFAEMALSYAISLIENTEDAVVTNYGCYLENREPDFEVRIKENTSWSCAHGVERWRSDCGCTTPTQEGWTQSWRVPLREALDFLRYHFIKTFQEYGSDVLSNPWEARNHYIEVLLDRTNLSGFIKRHVRYPNRQKNIELSLKLLEMQRNSMLMYTSCGWFFDEPSRPETLQILSYSLRAIQLHQGITSKSLLDDFLEILSEGKSNIPSEGTLTDMFRKRVMPLSVDNKRAALIGAFYFGLHPDEEVFKRGNLLIKRINPPRSESKKKDTLALHIEFAPALERDILHVKLSRPGELDTEVVFKGEKRAYGIKDLPQEERQAYIEEILYRKTQPALTILRRVYQEISPLLGHLLEPEALLSSEEKGLLEVLLQAELMDILRRGNLTELIDMLSSLKGSFVKLKPERLEFLLRRVLENNFRQITQEEDVSMLKDVTRCIEACKKLGFSMNLWTVQNLYYDMLLKHYKRQALPDDVKRLGSLLSFDMEKIKEQIDSE